MQGRHLEGQHLGPWKAAISMLSILQPTARGLRVTDGCWQCEMLHTGTSSRSGPIQGVRVRHSATAGGCSTSTQQQTCSNKQVIDNGGIREQGT